MAPHLETTDWRERILAAGDTPARRELHERHFASGPPRKLVRAFERLPLSEARVLDLGCGYGVYLSRLSADSVGLDLSPERVDFCRSIGLDARVADLSRPGWSAGLGPFDFVWACDMLPHLEDPVSLLREAAGLLRPGGALLQSDWLWPDAHIVKWLSLRLPGARAVHDEPEHFHTPSRSQAQRWLTEADYELHDSWNPSFRSQLTGALIAPIWPPRTLLARPRPQP
jgi:SAM-dependent methyltransferase